MIPDGEDALPSTEEKQDASLGSDGEDKGQEPNAEVNEDCAADDQEGSDVPAAWGQPAGAAPLKQRPLSPRPEQLECFERVKEENTIVNMPTGCGKTLVAVLAIDEFLPKGKAIFIVPLAALVPQQSKYIQDNSIHSDIIVTEAQAGKMHRQDMVEKMKRCDVVVGTAEIILQAFQDKRLELTYVSLIVFDECHHACGGGAMASIMRDVVHRSSGADQRIRVLGLTASFIIGSLEDAPKKRAELEGVMSSRMYCPKSQERATAYERINYRLEPQLASAKAEELVQGHIASMLSLPASLGQPEKNIKEVMRHGQHILEELGLNAFSYYMRACLLPQVKAQLRELAQLKPITEAELQPLLRRADEAAPTPSDLAAQAEKMKIDLPEVSNKAKMLLKLLRTFPSQCRIIVFCTQVVLTAPLAHLIVQFRGSHAEPFTGSSSMADSHRKQVMASFRDGSCPVLVCTSAAEEGIDVPDCQVVVRFSKVATTKAHIQGAGRARAATAQVFYFENDPVQEQENAKFLQKIAQAEKLSLTAEEMEERKGHRDVEGVHPFRTESGCEISVFNCIRLVNEYAQKVMRQGFTPEEQMLEYVETIISEIPRQTRKKLVKVTVPSPEGFFFVRTEDVLEWWGQVSVADIADAERIKRWKEKDKERRQFFFVVAVQLSQKGYLGADNRPTEEAIRMTQLACPVWRLNNSACIKSRFEGLPEGSAPADDAGEDMPLPASVRSPEQPKPIPKALDVVMRVSPPPTKQKDVSEAERRAAEEDAMRAWRVSQSTMMSFAGGCKGSPVSDTKRHVNGNGTSGNASQAQGGGSKRAESLCSEDTVATTATSGRSRSTGTSQPEDSQEASNRASASPSSRSIGTAPPEPPSVGAALPDAGLAPVAVKSSSSTTTPAASPAHLADCDRQPASPPACAGVYPHRVAAGPSSVVGRAAAAAAADAKRSQVPPGMDVSAEGNAMDQPVNWKGLLNENFPTSDAQRQVQYKLLEANPFKACVTFPGGTLDGTPGWRNKQLAEQSAAQAACRYLQLQPHKQDNNFKGQLNNLFPGQLKYDSTTPVEGGFVSTVTLPGNRIFKGQPCRRKVDAEHSAARAALEGIAAAD